MCVEETSRGTISRTEVTLPCFEKMLEVLNPWSLDLDLTPARRVNNRSNSDVDYILELLSYIEEKAAGIYTLKNQFKISEIHCQRAISYARRYSKKGETRVALLVKR
jgi:hypothetical protein